MPTIQSVMSAIGTKSSPNKLGSADSLRRLRGESRHAGVAASHQADVAFVLEAAPRAVIPLPAENDSQRTLFSSISTASIKATHQ
jgi:hypothetical protein